MTDNNMNSVTSNAVFNALSSKVNFITVQDSSTTNPITVIENQWNTIPNGNFIAKVTTSSYEYQCLVQKVINDYGAVLCIGYDNNIRFRSMFAGVWSTERIL